MSTFTKAEWKSILSIPEVAISEEIYKRIQKHKGVIRQWIDGSIIEIQRVDGSWSELSKDKSYLCFKYSENYRVQPGVELDITFTKKQALHLYKAIEECNFPSFEGREARAILMSEIEKQTE